MWILDGGGGWAEKPETNEGQPEQDGSEARCGELVLGS
jgi:hypothetical protein